jgi:uncharacterized protein (TIGR02996 family)
MNREAAFLEAIRAAPHDDGLRLVYADWLEEHGQSDKAEFLRLDCRLTAVLREPPSATLSDVQAQYWQLLPDWDTYHQLLKRNWVEAVGRPIAGAPRGMVRCRKCLAPHTGILERLTNEAKLAAIWVEDYDPPPLLPLGYFWVADQRWGQVQFHGHVCLANEEVNDVEPHPDRQRWVGCCGPPPGGLPNLLCGCGAEIGLRAEECCFAHFTHFDPQAILFVGWPDLGADGTG